MYRVRVRNITYPLNGSLTLDDGRVIKWSLPPGRWTDVDELVYKHLESKFREPISYEVPAALPDAHGNYLMPPSTTRVEQNAQYLLEFSKG